jgi:LEA14-like dessication related protein
MIRNPKFVFREAKFAIQLSTFRTLFTFVFWMICFAVAISSCKPKEDVVLRNVRDIVVDANDEPTLQAKAILYNPNKVRMKLRKIDIEVFVNGKKAALIDQKLQLSVPANAEFTVPLEARLNIQELGLFDTIIGIIGGKKLQVHYKGSISISYKGVPIKVPVNHQSEVRIRF